MSLSPNGDILFECPGGFCDDTDSVKDYMDFQCLFLGLFSLHCHSAVSHVVWRLWLLIAEKLLSQMFSSLVLEFLFHGGIT